MPQLKATSEWLRAGLTQTQTKLGVDRDKGIIYGVNVAQLGPFKDLRGEFDLQALGMIADQINATPKGLKSRYTHPSMSSDGLGKHLGRKRDGRVEGVSTKADLHLDPSSRNTPSGDLGGYVMDLAESDPEAFGSSLVLQADQKVRLDEKGRPKLGIDGEELPPLWYPKKLHASDVVDDGDAVHSGFLSAEINFDNLPDAAIRQACVLLDGLFPSLSRDVVDAKLKAFLGRYLDGRYGLSGPDIATLKRKLELKRKSA